MHVPWFNFGEHKNSGKRVIMYCTHCTWCTVEGLSFLTSFKQIKRLNNINQVKYKDKAGVGKNIKLEVSVNHLLAHWGSGLVDIFPQEKDSHRQTWRSVPPSRLHSHTFGLFAALPYLFFLVFWSFFGIRNPYFRPSCLVWVESGQVQQLLGLMIATMTMGGDYRPSAGDINSLPRHLLRFLFVEPKYPGAGFAHLYFWNLIIGTILIDKILMHDYQHNNDRNNFDVWLSAQ